MVIILKLSLTFLRRILLRMNRAFEKLLLALVTRHTAFRWLQISNRWLVIADSPEILVVFEGFLVAIWILGHGDLLRFPAHLRVLHKPIHSIISLHFVFSLFQDFWVHQIDLIGFLHLHRLHFVANFEVRRIHSLHIRLFISFFLLSESNLWEATFIKNFLFALKLCDSLIFETAHFLDLFISVHISSLNMLIIRIQIELLLVFASSFLG